MDDPSSVSAHVTNTAKIQTIGKLYRKSHKLKFYQKMKKSSFKIFAVLISLVVVLSSCSKTVVDKSVYVDSYIHSIYNRDGVPVFSVTHTAYTFSKLSSVTVTGAVSGTTIPLTDFSNGYSFYNPVGDSTSYKLTVPSPESYTFKATYANGEIATVVDATVAKYLLPAQQVNAVKDATYITLSWKPVTGVEAYKIRVFSENTIIYESDFLTPKDATSDLSVPFSLTSLSQYLSTNMAFEVSAFIFGVKEGTYHAVSAATFKKNFGN